jgi:hypothetical protein
MPALAFLAVACSVLVALLFYADATLEKNGPPAIITSQRSGLPEPSRHPEEIRILTAAPAPPPDMTSQAVLGAQPKAQADALTKIAPEARAARAEALPKTKRLTLPIDHQQNHYPETQFVDRLSIRGQ